MAILSRKEFSEKTGIRHTHIPTYASRGKIVIESDGNIDTAHPTNQEFISARSGSPQAKKKAAKVIAPKKKESAANAEKNKPQPTKKVTKISGKIKSIEGIEFMERLAIADDNKKKRELDIQLKESELEKRRLDNEKKRGEAVPTEYVTEMIRAVSDGLRNAYHDATETVIILIGSRIKMSSEDTGFVRKQLNSVLNKAVDEGFETANKTLEIVVKDFSNKRGTGES
jgi:hypothetical protein